MDGFTKNHRVTYFELLFFDARPALSRCGGAGFNCSSPPVVNDLNINAHDHCSIGLEERMNGLSAGPYGNRAGDILLLAGACTNSPIEARHFFSAVSHYTWHGSACETDSHIPFILAQEGGSGERLRALMRKFGGDSPSAMALTPLVRALFGR